MTDTSTTTRPTPRDLSGQLMADAARRMLPVIAGKLLAAAADRAVEGIEGLADRLQELGAPPQGGARAGGGSEGLADRLEDLGAPAEDAAADGGDTGGRDADAGSSRSPMSAAFAFVIEQTRIVLRFLAQLAAPGAGVLR